MALTPLSQFFCAPILGVFSDAKGRRPAFIIGISAGCLGYIMAVAGIWLNSLWLLFLYRILVGASDATAAVAQATLTDISTEENKARRFSYLNASLGIGFTVGPFLGGVLADPSILSWFSYQTPLIIAGLFAETRKKLTQGKFNLLKGIYTLSKAFFIKNLKWLFLAGFFCHSDGRFLMNLSQYFCVNVLHSS